MQPRFAHRSRCLALAALLASAGSAAPSAASSIDPRALLFGDEASPDAGKGGDAAPIAPAAPAAARFGAKDSLRLDVEGDWSGDLVGTDLWQGRVGVAWFFVDDFEVALYGSAGYASEPGGTGAGIFGGDLQFRWHLLAADTWSVFVGGGCGLLGSSSPVPAGGTNFNFTPSAGVGVTFDVWEGTRAYVSARWYHVSNAGTSSSNPGFNGLGLWAGLSFAL
jgi:hypothetical protein